MIQLIQRNWYWHYSEKFSLSIPQNIICNKKLTRITFMNDIEKICEGFNRVSEKQSWALEARFPTSAFWMHFPVDLRKADTVGVSTHTESTESEMRVCRVHAGGLWIDNISWARATSAPFWRTLWKMRNIGCREKTKGKLCKTFSASQRFMRPS